ncbi:MAG: hypothetical protein J4G09_01595, partial [Proteobacteria bacterium]|nr:hypothetical protein [Pseudomonadota bacterium]
MIAIQGVSWRRRRAVDFRPVQGAVAADSLGNALAGLAGSIPNGVRSTTVSLTEITGVAARPVGVVFGLGLVALAFFPKLLALVLAIPGPVIAAYVTVMIATLFVLGMRMVISDGLDHRKSLIVGFYFWFGAGCQYGVIFPEYTANFAGGMLNSGLTAGGLAALLLNGLLELTGPRRRKIESEVSFRLL